MRCNGAATRVDIQFRLATGSNIILISYDHPGGISDFVFGEEFILNPEDGIWIKSTTNCAAIFSGSLLDGAPS